MAFTAHSGNVDGIGHVVGVFPAVGAGSGIFRGKTGVGDGVCEFLLFDSPFVPFVLVPCLLASPSVRPSVVCCLGRI